MALDHLRGCGNAARWGLAMRVGPGYRNAWLGELFGRMRMNMTARHTWPRTFTGLANGPVVVTSDHR